MIGNLDLTQGSKGKRVTRHLFSHRTLGVLLCAVLSSITWTMYGQGDNLDEPSRVAQKLFQAALESMDRGDAQAACPMLERVVGLIPGALGASLKLAECYEKTNRFASAWATYSLAAALARTLEQADREASCIEGTARVTPRLAYLRIEVSGDVRALRDLQVRRDGQVVPSPQWGVPLPMDAGKHVVEANAYGKKAWERTVDLKRDGASELVLIDGLKDVETSAPDSRAVEIEFRSSSPDELWVLQDANGHGICRLPCTHMVTPGDGSALELLVALRDGGEKNHRLVIPKELPASDRHSFLATPKLESGSQSAAVVLTTAGAAALLSGVFFAATQQEDVAIWAPLGGIGASATVSGILVLHFGRTEDELHIAPAAPTGEARSVSQSSFDLLLGPASFAGIF